MKRNPYSFKLDTKKEPKEATIDLRTNRSCERNSTMNSTSRTNIHNNHIKLETKTSCNALSTSRKTSISLLTSRSEKNNFEQLRKQQLVKKQSDTSQRQISENQTVGSTIRHKTSVSQTTNLSTFCRTLNTQNSDANPIYFNRPQRNARPKTTKFSFTKQPSIIKQQSVPQFQELHSPRQLKESMLRQLKINRSESQEVKDIDLKQQQKQEELQKQKQQLQIQEEIKQQLQEEQQRQLKQDNLIEFQEQQEIQIEFDMIDMTPSMSELRKRLDSQLSVRDSNHEYSFSTASKDCPRSKHKKQSHFHDVDQILGDVYSTESFECDDKCVGIEINKQEKTLDDKLKSSQLNVPSSFGNEINIYSSLEYDLNKKKLDQSTIERKLQQAFLRNQLQKKKEESIGSAFLIEYNPLDKVKSQFSAHKTISIIVLDEINEEGSKEEIQNVVEPQIAKVQTPLKPKRCSIFLHKNNLNFAQNKETPKISQTQIKQSVFKSNILKQHPLLQITKIPVSSKTIQVNQEAGCNEGCSIF